MCRALLVCLLFSGVLASFSCSAHRDERLGDTRLGCGADAGVCATGMCVNGQCVENSSGSVRAIGSVLGAPVIVEHQIVGDEVCSQGARTVCTLMPGSKVIWRAPEADGYRFTGWTGDAGCSSLEPTLTLEVQRDISCVANYVKRWHVGGTVADGQGTVVASSAAPFSSCQDGVCEVDQGSLVSLSAPSRDGFRLTDWVGDGCPLSTNASIDLTPTTADISCSAVYVMSLTVHGDAQGAPVTIVASSSSPSAACENDLCAVDSGSDVTLSAPPSDGTRFSGWSGDDGCSSTEAQLTIQNVTTSVHCSGNYVKRFKVQGKSVGTDMAIAASSQDAFSSCDQDTCEVDEGGSVVLLAPTVTGLRLASWDGTGCTPGNGASASALDVHQDRTCTAHYVVGVAVIGTVIGATGVVSAASTSPGASCSAGRCAIDVGGSVTLTAPDLPGRTFLGWEGDEGCTGAARALTLSSVSASKSCNARFAARYQVTGNSAPSGGGSVLASSSATNASCTNATCAVDEGSSVQLVARPAVGYRFSGFSGGGACTGNAASLSLPNVRGNTVCTANFVQRFAVTADAVAPNAGSAVVSSASTAASCSGGNCTVDAGADASVLATAAAGYRFTGWSGCSTGADNPLRLTNVRADQHCSAHFDRITYAVNALASAGGSVSGSVGGTACLNAQCTVAYGDSVSFSATPATGYGFAGWTDCITSAQPSITLDGINGPRTCRAAFTRIQLTVSATASEGGTASASNGGAACANGRCTVDYGGSVMLTATPATGYRFTGWSGCSAATTPALTLPNITANQSCVASFTRMQFMVQSLTAPANSGDLTCSSTGCGVAYGGAVTLTATAHAGYTFARWSNCSTSTSATLTLSNVTQDQTCIANFDRVRVSVTSSVAPANDGTVTCDVAGCTVDYGGAVTLTAAAAANYRFVSWSDCSTSTNPTLMLSNLTAAKNCVANFRPTTFTVVAQSDAPGTAAAAYLGMLCPNNTCTNVASGGVVAVQVSIPVSETNQVTLGGWKGCTVDGTTLSQSGNSYVYTSTVRNVTGDLTCTAQLTPAALIIGQTNPSTVGNTTVSVPAGRGYCKASDASSSLCFALPGAVPTFATVLNSGPYYLGGWRCTGINLGATTDANGNALETVSGAAVTANQVAICSAVYQGIPQ